MYLFYYLKVLRIIFYLVLLDALMYVSGTENESIILDKLPASNSYNMSLIVR